MKPARQMTAIDRWVERRSLALPGLLRRLQRDGLVRQRVSAARGPWVWIGGRRVLNFASSSYLGLSQHPWVIRCISETARIWGASLGMPSLYAVDDLTRRLEQGLANLVGQEKALVFSSTTHIALDVLPLLAGREGAIFLDEWAYPISRQGAAAARQNGARLFPFPHNDARALAKALKAQAHVRDKVVVCDGVYSLGGQPAALKEIMAAALAFEALVYVDDAHGIGVLGKNPNSQAPYGQGGGGTPCYYALPPGNLVIAGSLSKAFGVPLAFVAGPAGLIDLLSAAAGALTHSSPPALPLLAGALGALQANAVQGEALRRRLVQGVRLFRKGLTGGGVRLQPDHLFPIQTLSFTSPQAALVAGRVLRRKGIWPVLQARPADHPTGGALRLLLSAWHSRADIEWTVRAILELSPTLAAHVSQDEEPKYVSKWNKWNEMFDKMTR